MKYLLLKTAATMWALMIHISQPTETEMYFGVFISIPYFAIEFLCRLASYCHSNYFFFFFLYSKRHFCFMTIKGIVFNCFFFYSFLTCSITLLPLCVRNGLGILKLKFWICSLFWHRCERTLTRGVISVCA